ncbi:MAG: flavodoxin family protein [Candidatus Lokiarchaeota archaeon]|nr:flavodoxin family protein [Candidatus Lokiarchaeota archaeon]
MEKILIIHNSRFGNSKGVTQTIFEGLKNDFETKIDHIKDIDFERDINGLYGLIIATRIISLRPNLEIRKFIKKIDSYRKKTIPKTAVFYMHEMKWREHFKKGMDKTLGKLNNIKSIYPNYLEVTVDGNRGSIMEGQERKINEYINNLKIFLKS